MRQRNYILGTSENYSIVYMSIRVAFKKAGFVCMWPGKAGKLMTNWPVTDNILKKSDFLETFQSAAVMAFFNGQYCSTSLICFQLTLTNISIIMYDSDSQPLCRDTFLCYDRL